MPLAGSGQIVVIKRDGTDGSNYPLLEGNIDIGSGRGCDIRVPSKGFPIKQCSITVHKLQATLRNCSLSVPTVINSTPVHEKVLDHGDIITFTFNTGKFRWDYFNKITSQRSVYNHISIGDRMKPKLAKKTRKSIGRRKSEGVIKKVDQKTFVEIKTRRSLDTLPGIYLSKTRQVAVVKPQRRDMGNSSLETSTVILTPIANQSAARKSEGRSYGKGNSRTGNRDISTDLVDYDTSSKRRKTNEIEKLDSPVVLDKNKRAALMLLTSRSPVNRGSPNSPAVKRSPKSPSTRFTNENWPQMMAQNINVRESLISTSTNKIFDNNLSSKNVPNAPVLKLQLKKLTPKSSPHVNSKIPHLKGSSAVGSMRSSRTTPANTISTRKMSNLSVSKASTSAVKLTQARTPVVRLTTVNRLAQEMTPAVKLTPVKTLALKSAQGKTSAARSLSAKIALQKTSMRSVSKLPVKNASLSKITPMKSNKKKSNKPASLKINPSKAASIKKALTESTLVSVRSTPRKLNVPSVFEEKSPVKSSSRRAVPKKLSLEKTLSPAVKAVTPKKSPRILPVNNATYSTAVLIKSHKKMSPLKVTSVKKSSKTTPVILVGSPLQVASLQKISLKFVNDSASMTRSVIKNNSAMSNVQSLPNDFHIMSTRKSSTPKGSPKQSTNSLLQSPLSCLWPPAEFSPKENATPSQRKTNRSGAALTLKATLKTPISTEITPNSALKVTPVSKRSVKTTAMSSLKSANISNRKTIPESSLDTTPVISKVSPTSTSGATVKSSKKSRKLSMVSLKTTPTNITSLIKRTPKVSPKEPVKTISKRTPKSYSQNTLEIPFDETQLRTYKISPIRSLKSSLKTPSTTRKSAVKLKFKLTPKSADTGTTPKQNFTDKGNTSFTSSYFNLSGESLSTVNSLGESMLLYSSAKSTPEKNDRITRKSSLTPGNSFTQSIIDMSSKPKSSSENKSIVESTSSSFVSTRASRSNANTPATRKSSDFFTPKSEKTSFTRKSLHSNVNSKITPKQLSTVSCGDISLISSIRTAFNVLNNSQTNLKSALKSPDFKRKSGRKSATIKFDLSNVESPVAEMLEIGQAATKTSKNSWSNRSVQSGRSSIIIKEFSDHSNSSVNLDTKDDDNDDEEDDNIRYSINTIFKGNNLSPKSMRSNKSDTSIDLMNSDEDLTTVSSKNSSPSQSSFIFNLNTSVSPRQSGRKFLSETIQSVTPNSKNNSLLLLKKSSTGKSSPKCNIFSLSPIVSPKQRSPRTPTVQAQKDTIITTPNISKLLEMKASTPKVIRKSSEQQIEMKSFPNSRRSGSRSLARSLVRSVRKAVKLTKSLSDVSSIHSKTEPRKKLQGVKKMNLSTGRKSKSLIVSRHRRSTRNNDISADQISNSSGGTDITSAGTDNEIVITPKTTMKLIPEALKEKHSTAKKSKSRKNIIDHLTDLPTELFTSPVKRKLSQSMRQYNESFKLDDMEEASIRDASFELLNTGKKRERTLKAHNVSVDFETFKTPNVSTDMFVSPLRNSQNKNVIASNNNTPYSIEKTTLRSSRTTLNNDFINVSKKTPKVQKSPKNALIKFDGVKKLFSSARKQKSPKNDLLNIVSVKSFYKTPGKKEKSPRNDLSNLKGVKRLLKTPRNSPKSPENDITNVAGVKSLFLSRNRSPNNDLTDVMGVKKLLKTPGRVQKTPKNELMNVSAVKTLFAPKGKQKSPLNDLTRIVGIKNIFSTPKVTRSHVNSLSNISGIREMLETSHTFRKSPNILANVSAKISPMKAEKSASESMFDSLTGMSPVKTYSKGKISSMSSQKSSPNVTKSFVKDSRTKKYTETSTILATDSADNSQSNRSRRQLTIDKTNFSFEVSKVVTASRKTTSRSNDRTEMSILRQSTPANKRKKPSSNMSVINIHQLSPILCLSKSEPEAESPVTSTRKKVLSSAKVKKQIPAKAKKAKASPTETTTQEKSPFKKGASTRRIVKKEIKTSPKETLKDKRITRGKKSSKLQVAEEAEASPSKISPVKATRSRKAPPAQQTKSVESDKNTRGIKTANTQIENKSKSKAPAKKATVPADRKKKVTFAPNVLPAAKILVAKSRSTRSNKIAEEIFAVKLTKPTRSEKVEPETFQKSPPAKKGRSAKSKTTSPVRLMDEIVTTRKRKRGAPEVESAIDVVQPKIKKANVPKKMSPVKNVKNNLPAKKTTKKSVAVSKSSPVTKITRSTRQRK